MKKSFHKESVLRKFKNAAKTVLIKKIEIKYWITWTLKRLTMTTKSDGGNIVSLGVVAYSLNSLCLVTMTYSTATEYMGQK